MSKWFWVGKMEDTYGPNDWTNEDYARWDRAFDIDEEEIARRTEERIKKKELIESLTEPYDAVCETCSMTFHVNPPSKFDLAFPYKYCGMSKGYCVTEVENALKAWHLKYDAAMMKFWGYDEKEFHEDGYAEDYHDDDGLTYGLATALFDLDGKQEHVDEMKELFPELWEKALLWYKDGYHDT